MISQILASKHTDIVSSLILISSSASDHYLSDLASSDWGNTVKTLRKNCLIISQKISMEKISY